MIIEYLDLKLEVEINYKPENRHIYIRMRDGKLIINTYKKLYEEDIKRLMRDNYSFIKRQLSKKPSDDNHIIHLLGKDYDFKIVEDSVNNVEIKEDVLIIHSKKIEYSYLKKVVDMFYMEILNDYVISHYDKIFESFTADIRVRPVVDYKSLKGCYGRYNRKDNKITLSSHLAKYPPFYIRLVITHELCHVKYMNHQKEFYELFEINFPNAKKNQHILRKIKYNDYF